MRVSPVISSAVLVVLGLAGCGGKAKGPVGNAAGAGGGHKLGDRLPWEATLTVGATFELVSEIGDAADEDGPLTVTVTAIEPHSDARIYRLDWSNGDGPTTVTVEDGEVTVGDSAYSEMQPPWPDHDTDATCYGADYSNPEGCDDVCDASLCLSPTRGILSVNGLYAPNYGMFRQHPQP